jgi:hypothetical protein
VEEAHLRPLLVEVGEVEHRPRLVLAEVLDDLLGESPQVAERPLLDPEATDEDHRLGHSDHLPAPSLGRSNSRADRLAITPLLSHHGGTRGRRWSYLHRQQETLEVTGC